MTATDYKTLTDAQKFDLLERPEDWPEDPAAQAELAALLELHLDLDRHRDALAEALKPRKTSVAPWLLAAAAAAAVVLVPTTLVVRRSNLVQAAVREVNQEAQRRAQDRLWSGFFTQSSGLLQEFQRNPRICGQQNEDRNQERETAALLLQVSHQLAAQGAPVPEAEQVRNSLHAWLTELSLEDGCLTPARADELRQWAMGHKLEDEAERLGRRLKEEGS
jgi:hypothetical protein